jgi:hypothetical protein
VTDLVLLVVLPAEGWLLLWLGSPERAATFHRAADSPLTGPAAGQGVDWPPVNR